MGRIKKKNSHSGFKGSVLFTVLAVMMVMLILVLTTITLAGIASRKAYSTWFDNQTNYTAQSLVESVVKSFQPLPTGVTITDPVESQRKAEQVAMGTAIIDEIKNKGDQVSVDVTVDQGGTPTSNIAGYGTVQQLTFTNVGTTDEFNFGGAFSSSDQKIIIKVSAVVEMGDESSTYSTYVTGSHTKTTGKASPGGFVATGQNHGGSGSNDAPNTYGRVYVGIDGTHEVPYFDSTLANQASSGGDLYFNVTSLLVNASTNDPLLYFGRNDPENDYFSGLRVSGQLVFKGINVISSLYNPLSPDMANDCINNYPYIFAKEIVFDGEGAKVNFQGGPTNVFCNSINCTSTADGAKMEGNYNLICLDEGVNNIVAFDGSNLTRWVSTLTSTDAKYEETQTGNIYCKGNFENIGQNGGSIEGDLFVYGDLTVNHPFTVNGTVFYGGNLTGDKLNCPAGINKITSTSFDDFCSQCDAIKANSGSRFKDILKTKKEINGCGTPVEMFQTFDHLKDTYFESDKTTYKGTVESSALVDDGTVKEWAGESVIDTGANKYYLWGNNQTSYSGFQRIDINPGTEEMWINISKNLQSISDKLIVVDDSLGGTVRFFLEDGRSSNLVLSNTYIITKKYLEMLLNVTPSSVSAKPGVVLDLETYPSAELIPGIYIYAGSGNNVTVEMMNDGIITGDLVGASATFKSNANCNVKVDQLNYKVTDYDTVNNAVNDRNAYTVTRNNFGLRIIGSLEFNNQDLTNGFGYIHVESPPGGSGPLGAEKYSWSMQDGYSTY